MQDMLELVTDGRMALNREEFKRWLKAHKPGEVVGTSCRQGDCPIARYLGPGAVVTVLQHFAAALLGEPIPNPLWVRRFIVEVDDAHELGGSDITAAVALSALEEVERREGLA